MHWYWRIMEILLRALFHLESSRLPLLTGDPNLIVLVSNLTTCRHKCQFILHFSKRCGADGQKDQSNIFPKYKPKSFTSHKSFQKTAISVYAAHMKLMSCKDGRFASWSIFCVTSLMKKSSCGYTLVEPSNIIYSEMFAILFVCPSLQVARDDYGWGTSQNILKSVGNFS